jgi:hypothetical protein
MGTLWHASLTVRGEASARVSSSRPWPRRTSISFEAEKIAVVLGRVFPGLCEVVLHDLRDPQHAIRVIENNLSGREVGDSVTELGLARIEDPGYPSVIQNYPNQFPDGRPVKSTSIGIKNAAGEYIAALCLNLDVSMLSPAKSLQATELGLLLSGARALDRSCEDITVFDMTGLALLDLTVAASVYRRATEQGLGTRSCGPGRRPPEPSTPRKGPRRDHDSSDVQGRGARS